MAQTLLTRESAPLAVTERDQLFIVLPCYNEEENLAPLLNRIYESAPNNFACKVIAVDDGSSDGTAATILNLSRTFQGVALVKHSQNQGLGRAIGTGVTSAVSHARSDDLIVVMDADNTHDPALIMEMVRRLRDGYDVMIASRYVRGGQQNGLPPLRVVLSRILNLLIRAFTRLPVKDATGGYRGYRASILWDVLDRSRGKLLESKGFEASLEILAKAYWSGGKICEIPLQLEYDRKEGESKMHLIPTIRGYIRLFSHMRRWRALAMMEGV